MTDPNSFHISAGGGDLWRYLNRWDNFPWCPPEWVDRIVAAYKTRGCQVTVTASVIPPHDADRIPFDGRHVTCAEWVDWLLNDPIWPKPERAMPKELVRQGLKL